MSADGSMDDVFEATSRSRISNDEVKQALSNLMSSGSKEQINQANAAMSYSKHDNVAAMIYTGWLHAMLRSCSRKRLRGLLTRKISMAFSIH